MNTGSPIRFKVVFALAFILLVLLIVAANKNAALQFEKTRLADTTADLGKRLDAAVAESDRYRTESGQLAARLAEATNSSSASLSASQSEQKIQHDKLRAEIARLSGDNVTKDTQLDALRTQVQTLNELQGKTETAFRNSQTALVASSNEVARISAADADKAARLAQREQDLAAKVKDLEAANAATAQAAAAQAAAEKNAQATQTKLDAAQTELTTLKTKIAELEAEKVKAVVPPTEVK